MSQKSEITQKLIEDERANPNLTTETVSEVVARKKKELAEKNAAAAESSSKSESSAPEKPEAAADKDDAPSDEKKSDAKEFSEKHYKIQNMLRGNDDRNPKKRTIAKQKNQNVTLTQADVKSTLLFDLCENSTYVIEGNTSKVFLTECKDCEIVFKGRILTQVIDVWNCTNVKLTIETPVKMLQIDASRGLTITYGARSSFDSIVWAGCDSMTVKVPKVLQEGETDQAVEYDVCECGFEQMQSFYRNMTLDRGMTQFGVQFVKEKLISEMLVREQGGYLIAKRQMDQLMLERILIEKSLDDEIAARNRRGQLPDRADN